MTSTEQTFLLPDLGEGLTEAEVVRWLVQEGDAVAVDQPVVEVETAKSIVEVPSPYAGRVATLHAAQGETVDVGEPLITIAGSPDEVTPRTRRSDEGDLPRGGAGRVRQRAHRLRNRRERRPRATTTATRRHGRPVVELATCLAGRPLRRLVSPLVRRLARDGGVDLRDVAATGEGGVITRGDVVRALAAREAPAPSSAGERRTPLTGFRKAVAASLSRSRAEIPEATVWVDVDASALWELRESVRTPADPGPGLLAYLARFVVAGLRQYPVLNARLDTERQEIVEHDHVHLGLAVQGERGLVVPAVLNAETMTTDQLHTAIRDLTGRAREGRATPEELAAGTFTLNNYGGFRVDGSAAIINHPQVAILGFGRIIDRAWVIGGEVVPRKITQMSFAFDHRVCDGGTAAGFMRVVADAIENPAAAIRGL